MGNNTTKLSHPVVWAPIDPSPGPSSTHRRSPRAHSHFPTVGTSLITGTLPPIPPPTSPHSVPSTNPAVEHLEDPHKISWTDWAYVPRLTLTPPTPDISIQRPRSQRQDRSVLGLNDVKIVGVERWRESGEGLEPEFKLNGAVLKRRKEGVEKRIQEAKIQVILGKASEMADKLNERAEKDGGDERTSPVVPERLVESVLLQEVSA